MKKLLIGIIGFCSITAFASYESESKLVSVEGATCANATTFAIKKCLDQKIDNLELGRVIDVDFEVKKEHAFTYITNNGEVFKD